MYARKVSQIAESRRHLRRDCGSLTYRRPKARSKKGSHKREITFSRKRPLFLMFLFFVSQFFFLKSALFEFHEIKVEGAESVSESMVLEKLGLGDSKSYWDLSAASLEENLEGVHRLEKATVELVFPGRVEVSVTERQPSFYVTYRKKANKWFSSDASGVVLKNEYPPEGAIKFILPHPVKDGIHIRKKDLQVVRFFQDSLSPELRKTVRAINIGKKRQITLKVLLGKSPVWVRLGRPEKLEYKLFLLSRLMRQLVKDKAEIRSIDLRYSAPVVRKSAQEPED